MLPNRKDRLWNSATFKKYNNCYSYSIDEPDANLRRKRRPGRKSNDPGTRRKVKTCALYERLLRDDHPTLHKVSSPRCPCRPYPQRLIAMAVAGTSTPNDTSDDDFHFYRRDGNTPYWSHKPGSESVRHVDASGRNILDPQTANRNYRPNDGKNYTDFCGYYCMHTSP